MILGLNEEDIKTYTNFLKEEKWTDYDTYGNRVA